MSDPDRLLYFLSARGRTRMPALRGVIEQLTPEDQGKFGADSLRAYKLCRLLDMLGHSEVHRGGPGWVTIAAPYLARLPVAGRERYVLAGARSGATVEEVQSNAAALKIRVSVFDSIYGGNEPLVPRALVLETEAPDACRKFAENLGIGFSEIPSSWTLACFSQGLGEFEARLEWHPRNVSLGGILVYDPSLLTFQPPESLPVGSFLCRPALEASAFFAVTGDLEARVEDPDWGRHWALAKASVAAIKHDRRNRLVAVPKAVPLPRLLARALCLASGQGPRALAGDRRAGSRDYYIFGDVPPEIADRVAQKLGVSFAPQPINI
jgi:hypothetical protein